MIKLFDVFPFAYEINVPEGYSLVENKEHKETRLRQELQEKKDLLSAYEDRTKKLLTDISETEKELKALE